MISTGELRARCVHETAYHRACSSEERRRFIVPPITNRSMRAYVTMPRGGQPNPLSSPLSSWAPWSSLDSEYDRFRPVVLGGPLERVLSLPAAHRGRSSAAAQRYRRERTSLITSVFYGAWGPATIDTRPLVSSATVSAVCAAVAPGASAVKVSVTVAGDASGTEDCTVKA